MMALFTRQDYNSPVKAGRPLKTGLANSALVSGTKGGFWRIIGKDDSRSATNVHRLIDNGISTEAADLYCVSAASAQWQHSEERDLIALNQVHLRQDIRVKEDERWNGV